MLEEKRKILLSEQEKQSILFEKVDHAKKEWEMTMDCMGDMVILTDASLHIKRCNKAVRDFTGTGYSDLLEKKWTDILEDSEMEKMDFKGNALEYYHKPSGRWFYLNMYILSDGFVVTLHDLTEIKKVSTELEKKHIEIQEAYSELKQTQAQLLQQEKMASIGQLA
ncbi:MAG: PAS domain-containing protein, partial [Desulfobulbaceae bacterium]|nr:PAS domain-containing protein [Desulfobulbaceae bacterium]